MPVKSKKPVFSSAPLSVIPDKIKPMLATLADKPFDDPEWVFEVKWDGYRAIAIMNRSNVSLQSRNDKSFNEKFYPVYDRLVKWKMRAVLDGEIVVVNADGVANFGALQNWRSEADGELIYYVFDILWLNGHDLRALPLAERLKILNSLAFPTDIIRASRAFSTFGIQLFESAKKLGLEGIIAKKMDGPYLENNRSRDWLKIKTQKRQEVVIGGYTLNNGSSRLFSSLLVGVYEKETLVYTGKIGTGFNHVTQVSLIKQFRSLITSLCPFNTVPDINKASRFRPDPPGARAVWLKPKLVCEVHFTEITADGVMRHPSFEGMRTDKKSSAVILEKEISAGKARSFGGPLSKKNIIMASKGISGKTILNPSEETQVKKINGHELKFTHLSKVYWPKEKITKRDMLNYYHQAATYILPYLKDRPQSLNRFPNGIEGKSFYQKDVKDKSPDWLEKYAYHSEADSRDKEFLVCKDEASLLYMASLGCIEINPWSSTTQKPNHPNWCIIDFDPDKNSFNQVIEAAQVTHGLLDSIGVDSYCKTSGSTGIHIYIPLGAKYTYEESKEFARAIVTRVHHEIPKYTSIERPTANRKGKIYLDFLQNRPQATLAAPYSLRPKPGATVSMPLYWKELIKGLKMQDFTIKNSIKRLEQKGDIFKAVLGKGINMKKALSELEKTA